MHAIVMIAPLDRTQAAIFIRHDRELADRGPDPVDEKGQRRGARLSHEQPGPRPTDAAQHRRAMAATSPRDLAGPPVSGASRPGWRHRAAGRCRWPGTR